jgi:hypothetical protein
MTDYAGKYTEKKGNASCFDRDESALDNAAEGNRARPKLKGFNQTKGGFGSADNSAVDPSLKYSGGNSGFQGGGERPGNAGDE